MDAIPLQGRKEGGKKTQRKQNRWSNLESPMGTSLGKRKHQGLLGCLVQLHRRCTAQLLAVTVSWTTVGLAIPRAEQCRERAPPDLGNIFKVSRPIPHCHLVPPRGPPRSQQLPIGSSSRMGRTDQGRTEVKVKGLATPESFWGLGPGPKGGISHILEAELSFSSPLQTTVHSCLCLSSALENSQRLSLQTRPLAEFPLSGI